MKLFALTLFFFLFAGCTRREEKFLPAGNASSSSALLSSASSSEDAGVQTTRNVDSDGVPIPPGTYRRIISLYSAHTENLFALGAGDALIGGHKTCTYPPEAASLPFYDYTGDPEYIIAADPDLALIRPFIRRHSPEYIAELEKVGIPVVSLYPETFEEFDGYIRALAALAGADPEPALAEFHRALKLAAEKSGQIPEAEKPKVFFEATENGVRTVAEGSLPALAIAFAGGVNIAPNAKPVSPGSSIAEFGMERVLEHGSEIDAYVVQTGAMNPADSFTVLAKRPGYHTIKAVEQGKVLFINEKLISSPTFRYLEGVENLAQFLYPAAP